MCPTNLNLDGFKVGCKYTNKQIKEKNEEGHEENIIKDKDDNTELSQLKSYKFLGLSRIHPYNIKQLLDEAEHDRYVKNK